MTTLGEMQAAAARREFEAAGMDVRLVNLLVRRGYVSIVDAADDIASMMGDVPGVGRESAMVVMGALVHQWDKIAETVWDECCQTHRSGDGPCEHNPYRDGESQPEA